MNKNLTSNFEILSKLPGIYFWEKDLNGTFVWTNEEFSKKIAGFRDSQDVLGMSDAELFDDFVYSIYQAQDREALCLKNTIKIFDIIKSKKMEKPIICLTTKTPKYNKNNIATGTVGHSVDVTDSFVKVGQFLSRTQCEKTATPEVYDSYIIGQKVSSPIKLSPRESECLFFLLRNRSAKETARLLNIEPKTVQKYIEYIKIKFNARTRSEIFDKATEYGLFNIIPEKIFNKEISMILGEL